MSTVTTTTTTFPISNNNNKKSFIRLSSHHSNRLIKQKEQIIGKFGGNCWECNHGMTFTLCWSCCHLCTRCCRRLQNKDKIHYIVIPITSFDLILDNDSPFAFNVIKADVAEYILQNAWQNLYFGQVCEIIIVCENYLIDSENQLLLAEENSKFILSMKQKIQIAINNTFRFKALEAKFELIRIFSQGITATFISIIWAIILSYILVVLLTQAQEGVTKIWLGLLVAIDTILLWVVIWVPLELWIFGRFLTRIRFDVCQTLGDAEVSIVVGKQAARDMIEHDGYQFVHEQKIENDYDV
jgi:hypothetical protein